MHKRIFLRACGSFHPSVWDAENSPFTNIRRKPEFSFITVCHGLAKCGLTFATETNGVMRWLWKCSSICKLHVEVPLGKTLNPGLFPVADPLEGECCVFLFISLSDLKIAICANTFTFSFSMWGQTNNSSQSFPARCCWSCSYTCQNKPQPGQCHFLQPHPSTSSEVQLY